MTTIEHLLRQMHSSWDDAAALGAVGRELHDRNRLDHARVALERSLELDPSSSDNWQHLSYCFFRSLDEERGRDALRRGLEATGSDAIRATLSHFATDDAEKQALLSALSDTTHAGARLGVLSHDLYGERPSEAAAEIRDLVRAHPDDEEVLGQWLWSVMGGRHRGVFDTHVVREEGIPVADRLIERNPTEVFGTWMKLQLLFAEKDFEAAIAETERALRRFPDEETVMQLRGRALVEAGRLDEAAHWFARAIGAKPSFVGARVELGKLYEKMSRPQLAEAVFREIPVANPSYAMGPASLALFLGRQGRWEEAESIFLGAWPRIPAMFQNALRQSPQAQAMFERDAVKAEIGEAGRADRGS